MSRIPVAPVTDLAPLGDDRLPPEVRYALTQLVAEARERQRHEVQLAIDTALTHIPALLRGAVRKLLFG